MIKVGDLLTYRVRILEVTNKIAKKKKKTGDAGDVARCRREIWVINMGEYT